MIDEKAAALIKKARAGLILDQPFFGALALKLRMVEDPAEETGCTDGREIRYNPAWINSLSLEQVKGVLAHEVMHCASNHHTRRGTRDPKKWNVAGDYVINSVLEETGFRLPADALDGRPYKGMSTDAVYAAIPDPAPGGGSGGDGQSGNDQDPGGCGGVEDAKDDQGNQATAADQTKAEQDWKVSTIQAAQAAKMMGKLPGAIERMLDPILNPKVDWRDVLRNFLERAARNDYSWRTPNPRYIQQGIYLPRLHSLEMGDVVVAVDTSGSIGQDELSQFAGELSGMLEAYDMTAHVVYVDARVQAHETFTSDDLPLELHPKGGGGTDFKKAFDWVVDQDLTPAAMVYLTDLWGRFPAEAPDYPVIWCVIDGSDQAAPFGETIHV
jgi:predicted metal-dependent peptidase